MKQVRPFRTSGIWKPVFPCLLLLCMLLWLFVSDHGSKPTGREAGSDQQHRRQGIADTPIPDLRQDNLEPRNIRQVPPSEDFVEKELWENRNQILQWATRGDAVEGMQLARRRGELMAALIPRNPDLALEAMLPLPVYLQLTAEMRKVIEQPFAVAGTLDVVPDCERGGLAHFGSWEGGRRTLHFAAGRGERVSSKNRISLSGVELGGVAAVHGTATWMMDKVEMAAARQLFGIQPASAAANALVAGDALYLDSGGQERVAMLHARSEELPGPDTGAVLALMSAPGEEETAALLRDVHKVSQSWTLSDKRILFLNLKFADTEPAESSAAIHAKLAQCGARTEQMSYGKMKFSKIAVSEVLTLPGNWASYTLANGTDIDYSRLRNEGLELAVAAGLISGSAHSEFSKDYDIIGVVFPEHPDAWWLGRGTVAGSGHWINGNVPTSIYLHEFGHNYGLQHASSWNESDPAQNPPTPPSTDNLSTSSSVEPRHIEYGDSYDYMGSSGSGHDYGAFGKNRLSWIDDEALVELTGDFPGDQVVRLQAFDEPTAHDGTVLGARVQMQGSETFWVYYRGNHPDTRAQAGANVLWQFANVRGRLLDMSPESTAYMDLVLKPGRSYSDPSGKVKITALAQGESNGRKWLDVRIITGVDENNNTNPVLLGLEAEQSGKPLQNLNFSATATDADGDSLLFNWDFGDGSSVTTSDTTLSHSYMVGGTYLVRLRVVDERGAFTEGEHSITINDPLFDLTKVSLGASFNLKGIVHSGGRFYTCHTTRIWGSFDGLEWESIPKPSNVQPITGIGSAGDSVVIFGQANVNGQLRDCVWKRSNESSWIQELIPRTYGTLKSFAMANGVEVVGGGDLFDKSALLTKVPGGIWKENQLGETRQFQHIFHDGRQFWALGDNNLVLVSANGLDWSPPPVIPKPFLNGAFTTGATMNGKTYIAGDSGRLAVTANTGASWLDVYGGSAHFAGMTGIPGRVLCFERLYPSNVFGNESPGIYVTLDGSRWLRAALPEVIPMNHAAYGAGRVVVVGDYGKIHASGILDSANTAPSGNVSLPATVNAREDFSPSGSYSDADGDPLRFFWDLGKGWFEAGPKPVFRFLIGGSQTVMLAVVDERGGLQKQTFKVSVRDPFRSFVAIEDSGLENYTSVTSVGNQVFALSFGKLHSGTVGNPLHALPNINMYPSGLASDGTDLVLVGQQTSVGAISRGSATNPVPLTKVDIPAGGYFTAVAYGGGAWVAVGSGGRICSSVAGGAWGDRVSGVSRTLFGIAYGNGIFMASGENGTVLVSGNGVDWTLKPAPSSSSLSKVVFCGNGFLVCGSGGLHFTGNHGTSWKSTSLTKFSLTTAVWTGDAILVLGSFYDSARARWVGHLLVSMDGGNWERVEDERLLGARDITLSGTSLVAVGNSGLQAFAHLVEPPPPAIWIIEANPRTQVQIGISSNPGQVFDVFRSANLTDGFGDLPYAAGIPAASSGEFTEWIDNAPLPKNGFYRIRRKQ